MADEEIREEQQESAQPAQARTVRRYIPRKKVCAFCVGRVDTIDYKQPQLLYRFLTDRGKIKPRRQTGVCAKHQRRLAKAIKRARHLALLPYSAEHVRRYG